jgi:pyridoxamine 5'-phosphate oxidase
LAEHPLARFRDLLERARSLEQGDASAMALATVDGRGQPSVRMVQLRSADARGFVFFTSYESRKARDLDLAPRAALCLHWPALTVQVRAEGRVERIDPDDADCDFAARPRAHQLASWASHQSAPLPSRSDLLERLRETDARFRGEAVPRPAHWGGYRLVPETIEFWHGFEHRLHDRVVFTRSEETWSESRLSP